MFADWIYRNPTWYWGAVLVAVVVAVSCTGLLVFNRVPHPWHSADRSDACAAVFGVSGTMYAVLIAFVAVAAWQVLDDGNKLVQAEAGHITNIYRDVAGLEPHDVELMRKLLREYANHVATDEWAAQMAGKPIEHKPGRQTLARLYAATLAFDERAKSRSLVQTEVLRELNEIYKARRARHLAAGPNSGIPSVVWWIIVIGTSLTIFASYLLAVSSVRLHLLLVAIASSCIALVIVLVLALDQPFRGELCISNQPFVIALDSMLSPAEGGKQ